MAVVDVEYFWHFTSEGNGSKDSPEQHIHISNAKGKLTASSSFEFDLTYSPVDRDPKNIKAELFLMNVPEKSLQSKNTVKVINGI